MGRDNKNNKHYKVKDKIKNIWNYYGCPFCICISVYIALLIVGGLLRLGSAWETWKINEEYLPLILSLSIYRILEYILPAVVIKSVMKKSWHSSFNNQFASYALINAIVFLLGLDYACDFEFFSSSESFIIIIGYVASMITKENVTIESTFNANDAM